MQIFVHTFDTQLYKAVVALVNDVLADTGIHWLMMADLMMVDYLVGNT